MGKWHPWQQEESNNRYLVKVHKLKLEGFNNGLAIQEGRECENIHKTVGIEIKLKRSKSGLIIQFPVSFSSKWQTRTTYHTTRRLLLTKEDDPTHNNSIIEWDEEFGTTNHLFSVPSDDASFGSWDLSFKVLLYGGAKSKNKSGDVVGKVSLNVAETASKKEPPSSSSSPIERKLPIALQFRGETREASLTVLVSFTEVRNCEEFLQPIQNLAASTKKEDGIFKFKIPKAFGVYKNRKKQKKSQETQVSCSDSTESPILDSVSTSLSGPFASSGELSSGSELGRSPSSVSRVESVSKKRLMPWKRKRQGCRSSGTEVEPLIERQNEDNGAVGHGRHISKPDFAESSNSNLRFEKVDNCNAVASPELDHHDENSSTADSTWEFKELLSRDGHSKLKSDVFFASFDQRSEQAAGESACTALVTVIAHWLHSNHYSVPTRPQFDALIKEGSLEWQKLCNNETNLVRYPNKHFELETVLQAHIRPIEVVCKRSRIGFFSPEKFDPLKEAMSFDDMWDRTVGCKTKEECEGVRVYIVSWNDHFFVLMVGAGEYYIIDSLGERLFEGCDQAYILKFDESTVIFGKQENNENSDGPKLEGDVGVNDGSKEKEIDQEAMICKGKECCKEFMKRFFAAISVEELEEENKKGSLSVASLYRRLQIEFHYCGLATSVPTSSV